MKKNDPLRDQVAKFLDWGEAHVDFDTAVKGIPTKLRGVRPRGVPYSLWQIVEHIRLAQEDILDFCVNPKYRAKKWPADYWPSAPKPPNSRAWAASVAAVRRDRRKVERLARNSRVDLHAKIPHGKGQTYLREILLVADHEAYHVGEIVLLRRMLGIWK
jgi:hypothetical protein